MQYLVIMKDKTMFMTNWYNYENCWNNKIFCVVDTIQDTVTYNGKDWTDIDCDQL